MNINYLPLELLLAIFQKLNWQTRITCKLVCKLWLDIFMTSSEFQDDRFLELTNCYFDIDKPPMNIFNKSLYSQYYKCKQIMLDFRTQENYNFNENIEISCFEIKSFVNQQNRTRLAEFNNVLKCNKNVKVLKFPNILLLQYYVSCDETFKCLRNVSFCSPTIEKLIITNCFEQDIKGLFFENIFNLLFPNLKVIQFENYIGSTSNLTLNSYINLAPSKYQIIISNFNINADNKFLLSYYFDIQPIEDENYKVLNSSNISNETSLKLKIEKSCFSFHKVKDLTSIRKIQLSFTDDDCCSTCLECLGKSLKNVKQIELHITTCTFQFNELNLIEEKDLTNHVKFYKYFIYNQELTIHLQFNYKYIINLMKFVLKNYKIRIFNILILHYKRPILSEYEIDEISDIIVQSGQKLRVSYIFLLFFYQILLLFFFHYLSFRALN